MIFRRIVRSKNTEYFIFVNTASKKIKMRCFNAADREPVEKDIEPLYLGNLEAVFNHTPACCDHRPTGGSTYFLPLVPGAVKKFDISGNICCHGTGLESAFKYICKRCSHLPGEPTKSGEGGICA